jgi:hypothetical protein
MSIQNKRSRKGDGVDVPIVYCERWNKLLAKPIGPLTESEARARHGRGELYAVAYVPDGQTEAVGVIEVRLEVGYARIHLFDEHGRVEQIRTFDRRGERMFLEESTDYAYPESTERLRMDQASVVTEHAYNEDGTGRVTVHRPGTDYADGWDLSLKPGQSMDNHWVPVPDFGDYDALGRAGLG